MTTMQSILKIPRWGAPACLLLFLLLPLPAGAGHLVPRLVRDVDRTTYAGSSSPRQLSGVNRGFAFTAFGNRELWMYDDTEDAFSAVLKRQEIRQLADAVYAAREASGRWTIWLAQGWPYFTAKAESREPLADLGAAYRSEAGFGPLLVEAGRGKGRGLWRVDLLQEETVEIARPLPLADGHLLRDLTLFGDRAFFVARDRNLGSALWVMDTAGAHPVFAPVPGETPPMRLLGVVGGRLLLAVSGGAPELWLSNGTPRGTRPLAEIVRGPGAAAISDAVGDPFHNWAYLVADDGRHGRQLWTTDGTAAGTRRLTSFAARDPFAASPLTPTLLADRLVFFATTAFTAASSGRPMGHRQGRASSPTSARAPAGPRASC